MNVLVFVVLAVLANLFWCWFLLLVERTSAVEGEIPQRGEILYLRDFAFFKWGDIFCLSGMDAAIAIVVVTAWPISWPAVWVICGGVVSLWCLFWHRRWMSTSRPRVLYSLYPEQGQVSKVGLAHLPYLSTQYFFGLVGLWELVTYRPISVGIVVVGVVGVGSAICYFYTLLWVDRRAGRMVL